MNLKQVADQMIQATREFVARALQPIESRLAALEARPMPERGERGLDGKDGTPGRDGKDGRDGIDGKDGAPGRDGVDGKNGVDGKDGRDGERGEKGERGEPGPPGPPGERGEKGDPGVRGERGEKGDPGADGKSVTLDEVRAHVDSQFDSWALGFERRATDMFMRMMDNLPKPKDGVDGMGFDDLEILHDGERTFTFRMQRGDRVKEKTFKLPVVLERGIYNADRAYEPGDGVTYGGAYWIAQVETKSRPGEGNPDWRLAVKKGRDGKDGQKGDKGDQGPPGRPGRDLTQLGGDGSKW